MKKKVKQHVIMTINQDEVNKYLDTGWTCKKIYSHTIGRIKTFCFLLEKEIDEGEDNEQTIS